MDTSETYIKMCKKAEEIQKAWKPEEGDFVSVCSPKWRGNHIETVLKNGLRDSLIISREWEEDDFLDRDISLWLPRQDQLQEMVFVKEEMVLADLIRKLDRFLSASTVHGDGYSEYACQFTSMEQLWLAFVMRECFSKIWSGEEWKDTGG